MKIGFSLGKCVRDIANGTVDYDDVVMIISGTLISGPDELAIVINDYCLRDHYLQGMDEERALLIANTLWSAGKIIQPRLCKNNTVFRPFGSHWCDIAPSYDNENAAVQNAWDSYRTVAALAGKRI